MNAVALRLRRLSVSTFDVEASVDFYQDVFGFADLGESTRIPHARAIRHESADSREYLEIDLVKTVHYWRLPDPVHLAFEADKAGFDAIYKVLKRRGTKVLSAPIWEPHVEGLGEWSARDTRHQCYFFPDPNLSFLEVLYRLPTPWAKKARLAPGTLKVNHFVVGAHDVGRSVAFYADIFDFKDRGPNFHVGTARDMVHYSGGGDENVELVVHPLDDWRTPNPAHLALEVDSESFLRIHANAVYRGMTIYAEREPEAPATGVSETTSGDAAYKRFFIVDPSRSRIEVMTRI